MNTFCTIVTQSHIAYAKAILHSLNVFHSDMTLHVLVVDRLELKKHFKGTSNLIPVSIMDLLKDDELGKAIRNKYNTPQTQDELRWSLKPILIRYLLQIGYEKVLFTDPDTYYFNDYQFLFDELNNHNVILTPHWRGKHAEGHEVNYDFQLIGGLYNAGFIGANKHGIEAMEWWAKSCLHRCIKDFNKGHYVDQTYLNLMPIYFKHVGIVKHRGCNLAVWNIQENKRTQWKESVLINGEWEIVFIHFAENTIRAISDGRDPLLLPYLNKYEEVLALA